MNSDSALARAALSGQPHPPSVWATSARAAPVFGPLARDVTTDVVVVGAGFTGLNAAWELAQRGVSTVVLEANDAGWGASGRNGGMAVLRYKKAWSALARRLGDDTTRRLYRWIHEALDTLERNVQELHIECGFSRCGHITAANGPRAITTLRDDCDWLASRAGDATPQLLDASDARRLLGTDVYPGGYLDRRSAGIHPLDYSRGFAAALAGRGIPIHCGTPVHEVIAEPGGVKVRTADAWVTGKQVLMCTNAYTDLFAPTGDLERRIVPVSTSVVTTCPLPEALRRTILPEGQLVTDTRHLVNYFRHVPGDRILFGGRGSLTGDESPGIYDGLIEILHRTYPQLRAFGIDHRWSGKVAVTLDDFPHIGSIGDRVFYALGYGGRGVALTNLLGKHLARRALGETTELGPMSEARFRPIPWHGLRIPAMNLVAGYYKLRDRLRV